MAHGRNISVVGLGYIGLPVAVAFGKRSRVVGFDLDAGRIEELRRCVDRTREIEPADLAETDICFTSNAAELREADFHIVAAPTPIDRTMKPDLRSFLGAARTVGRHLKPGDIVVFESTVYPGVTEEDCVPVLEDASGLVCGTGFTVGYSPERINPGDREHTFTRIAKIVAGQDEATLDIVASVYESVVTAGVYRAATIRVAEAAKVIENTQRDLDIALMNELALIFARMGIDTRDMLAAAGARWNFLPFTPGLVGGHCISVAPYYLAHKAAMPSYLPEVILAGRRVNDGMGAWVAGQAVKALVRRDAGAHRAAVTMSGVHVQGECPRPAQHARGRHRSRARRLWPRGPGSRYLRRSGRGVLRTRNRDCRAGSIAPGRRGHSGRPAWRVRAARLARVIALLRDARGIVIDVKGVLDRAARPGGIELLRL